MNRILLLGVLVFSAGCPRVVPGVDCRLDGDCDILDECVARVCTPRTPVGSDAGVNADASISDDVISQSDAGLADASSGADASANDVQSPADVTILTDSGVLLDGGLLADAAIGSGDGGGVIGGADGGNTGGGGDGGGNNGNQDAGVPGDVESMQDVIGVDVEPECMVPSTVANLINIEGSVESPGQDGSTRRLFVRNVVQGETFLITAAVEGDATATLSAINVALSDVETITTGDITILYARGEVLQSGNASVQVDSILDDVTAPIVIGLARYRPKSLDLSRDPLFVGGGDYTLNAGNDEELTLLGSAVFRDRSHVLDAPNGLVRRFEVFGLSIELTHQPACGSRVVAGTFTDTGPLPFCAARLETLAPGF